MTAPQLKSRIEKLGITQQEFAKRIDVAPNSVWRWTSGAVRIPRLVEIAVEHFESSKSVVTLCAEKNCLSRCQNSPPLSKPKWRSHDRYRSTRINVRTRAR